PYPLPPAPTAVPLPPATFLSSEHVPSAPLPVPIPAPAVAYTIPPPTVFPAPNAPAPTHLQATELPPYPSLQPHAGLSYQAPPPINTTYHEPGTPTHAAQFASPTYFFPETDAEQERRLKRMEETIRALQSGDAHLDARYGDCSLFPGMRLPPKFKISEFKTYEGTTDPRHHLRHYREKMLQYSEYEEFVIHSFQDSLSGSALDWFMSLKAEDVPTWEDLSRKFIDQYRYCAEMPPTLLELSTKEMAQGQRFEEYATKWRAQAAKHIPPIIPTSKGEESSKKVPATSSSSGGRRGKEVSVNAVDTAHQASQQYSMNFTSAPPVAPSYTPHYQPPAPRASQPTQRVPPPQGQQDGAAQSRPRRQYPALSVPLSHIYRQVCDKIRTIAPGPSFDPTIQDQTKQCEYHRGAPGHTLDNCWRPPNVQANPLPDHGPTRGPSINMITVCIPREGEGEQGCPSPFMIEYVPAEVAVGFTGIDAPPAPLVIDIPAREPYSDDKVPWTYEGGVGSLEQPFGVMGITRSGRLYENPAVTNKGKAPVIGVEATPEAPPTLSKKVPKGTSPDRIEETVNSIFSNAILFSDNELPPEGCAHSQALHIVCKCNNHIVGRVMIDNGSALNVCPVTTLKQMNVDLNRVRPSKTAVRAFDGSRREVNGEIDLPIEVGPCSFNVTFQVLDIPNAFSLLLGRPWIHSAGAIPSSLHQKVKFIVKERIITVKGEEDYAVYKETAVPYISVGNDENLPFHSFETISELATPLKLKNISIGGDSAFAPPATKSLKPAEATISTASPHIMEDSTGACKSPHSLTSSPGRHSSSGAPLTALSRTSKTRLTLCQLCMPSPRRFLQGFTSARLHSNPNLRHVGSNPSEECLGEPGRIYFGEGLDEDSLVPEIEESLHRLEDRQLTSVEPTEEINVGTEDKPRNLKIGTGSDPTQRARMIDFLTRYQEVFAWSYADMPGLDPSIVKHFLPLDTEKFPPKRQQLRRQRASLLLRIKEEVVKQINAGFLEVCNYSEWVANIMPVEKKDGRVRVRVDYRDLNKASPKDNFPLPHIDILVDNTARHAHARSGKLLEFVVSERGIKVDPDKVKAIKELPPPSSVREVRGFLGRLNYIARFIANLTNKCQPLFRLLRKNAAIEWDEECQKAFDTIKAYLVQPPVLVPPTPGHPLVLYLTADPLKYLFDSPSSTRNLAKWRCIGAVLISPDGRYYLVASKIDFSCTNNVAEYKACILGLQAAIDFKVKELEVFGDSMLTIFQTLGQWKTKDAKLVPYHEYLEKLAENFEDISFTYTPRMTNQFADALATLSSMVSITKENLIEPLEIEIVEGPAHCNSIEASEAKPWYEDIKNLLRTGQYPPFAGRCDRKTLRRLAIHYFLNGEVYANQIKAPPNELRPMTAPWPFSMWGMDVIGPINPKASNRHMFILVAVRTRMLTLVGARIARFWIARLGGVHLPAGARVGHA
ncbi:hypothetical protein CRG98_041461, partial [Punica granatum]